MRLYIHEWHCVEIAIWQDTRKLADSFHVHHYHHIVEGIEPSIVSYL